MDILHCSKPLWISTPNLQSTNKTRLQLRSNHCAILSHHTAGLNVFSRGALPYLCPTKKRPVVVGAGPPSTTSLIFAFVFPLSLIAFTVFTSIRIADKLDQQFLEELAMNQAIMEEEDQDEDNAIFLEEEPALPRTRNRPKREA